MTHTNARLCKARSILLTKCISSLSVAQTKCCFKHESFNHLAILIFYLMYGKQALQL